MKKLIMLAVGVIPVMWVIGVLVGTGDSVMLAVSLLQLGVFSVLAVLTWMESRTGAKWTFQKMYQKGVLAPVTRGGRPILHYSIAPPPGRVLVKTEKVAGRFGFGVVVADRDQELNKENVIFDYRAAWKLDKKDGSHPFVSVQKDKIYAFLEESSGDSMDGVGSGLTIEGSVRPSKQDLQGIEQWIGDKRMPK